MDIVGLLPYASGFIIVATAVVVSCHAVLRKRDSRAAVAWVGLILLAPVVGIVLYGLFGINRVRRRAATERAGRPRLPSAARHECTAGELERALPEGARHLAALHNLAGSMVHRVLLSGNRIDPLFGGVAAYGEMLRAIDASTASVSLSTFIFDDDEAGGRFANALDAARRRGVEVRVLIDAIGGRYSWPPMHRHLRRRGLTVARFMPALFRSGYANLRNHRKILVADGRVGFTGGMNIRDAHLSEEIRDVHFSLRGPVVAHLQEVFAEDWAYSTGEILSGERWFPLLDAAGATRARGLADGPDEDFETMRWTFLGALSVARRSVRVVTPYFLPDAALLSALGVAGRRGVQVEVVLPERNNQALVAWACMAQLWQILAHGCRVYMSPPPFDHTKMFLVDGAWALIGSSNWDPRSLRLNFEFDVECYDADLACQMEARVDALIAASRRVTLSEVDGRPMPIRLRDSLARLMAPYL